MASSETPAHQLTTSAADLNKIDRLRELGVASYVELPQLVVVGKQSSGKSSVLEALTGLSFPTGDTLCTTFPTQITFRNAEEETTVVSIIPLASSPDKRKAKLRKFKKEYPKKSFNSVEFDKVLREVRSVIGTRDPKAPRAVGKDGEEESPLPTFSQDILKIELSGPQRENLSIIDTPGIFERIIDGTTKADKVLVQKMVESYIKHERTIILAIVPATEDEANWGILPMVQKEDRKGVRTLVVITKPDLMDEGTEERIKRLVRGEKNPLKLGYYLVRNKGEAQKSKSTDERDTEETKFFAQEVWSSLSRDRVGVKALKGRLQQLLGEISRRELPKVKLQISTRLEVCRAALRDMGADRKSTVQQQIYLSEMATNFQKITDHALDAYYNRNPIFSEMSEMRLPTLVVDRSDKFALELEMKGHTVAFESHTDGGGGDSDYVTEDDEEEGGNREAKDDDQASSNGNANDESGDDTPQDSVSNVSLLAPQSKYPEILILLADKENTAQHEDRGIIEWIDAEYRRARGGGLQVSLPSVLPTLWQKQSRNWRAMTWEYFSDIITFVHNFIVKLMEQVCPDERTRSGLMAILLEKLIAQYQVAINHVEFLLDVELDGTPLTKNPSFQENLQKYRLERLDYLKSEKTSNESEGEIGDGVPRLEDALLSRPTGDIDFAVNDIFCILKAYYEIARRRYVDAVCTQGTDYHLLNGKNSPLRIFSPVFVAALTPEQLEEIAGEDLATKERREALQKEMDALEEGRRLLSR